MLWDPDFLARIVKWNRFINYHPENVEPLVGNFSAILKNPDF